MKRAILVLCLLSMTIVLFTACGSTAKNPYKDLSAEDISSATVELRPPHVTVDLSEEEIQELVAVLQTVETYEKDNSYSDYAGQGVIYTLTKTDGSTEKIMAYNPFLVINDVGYKTKYEPCEELNALGNTTAKTPFGRQTD